MGWAAAGVGSAGRQGCPECNTLSLQLCKGYAHAGKLAQEDIRRSEPAHQEPQQQDWQAEGRETCSLVWDALLVVSRLSPCTGAARGASSVGTASQVPAQEEPPRIRAPGKTPLCCCYADGCVSRRTTR